MDSRADSRVDATEIMTPTSCLFLFLERKYKARDGRSAAPRNDLLSVGNLVVFIGTGSEVIF